MILSDLLLSAWILNTYNESDQKLYMTTLHLKTKMKNKNTKSNKFNSKIQTDKVAKSIGRSKI